MNLSKEDLMDLISEEKNKYSLYLSLCAYYKIEPGQVANTKCSSKTEVLEAILKLM